MPRRSTRRGRWRGSRINANEGGQLKWLGADGRIKVAYLIGDRGSWHVVLCSDLVYVCSDLVYAQA
ncbi:hypothetical protein [Kocuria rhizophila]|uniref:hypothetical protein n=1 Tax=Kocuria rhizophila TaxID=72000 RepID=UPI0011A2F570|nr:hypothetical protein [Kocuria rhizophila]